MCAKVRQRRDSGRRSWTSAEVGRAARRARLRVCPDADQEARQRAFAEPACPGPSRSTRDGDPHRRPGRHRRPSHPSSAVRDRRRPGTTPADSRTRDQLRADVLVDLLLGGDPITGAARRPEISVVMSLPDLLGVTDHPAHVPGLGPIPADLARTLAADATWRAWITDASGAVVATGSSGLRPHGRNRATRACPRAGVPDARLPTAGEPLRPGPHNRLPGWSHLADQPRSAVPAPPCVEDPHGLDPGTARFGVRRDGRVLRSGSSRGLRTRS